jgi:hypothetical protein
MDRAPRLRWQDFANLAIGIALGFSPWLLGFFEEAPVATWNALVAGATVIVLAAVDMEKPANWGQWMMALIGVWLALSPAMLGFEEDWIASAVTILAGTVVFVVAGGALLSAVQRSRKRGG